MHKIKTISSTLKAIIIILLLLIPASSLTIWLAPGYLKGSFLSIGLSYEVTKILTQNLSLTAKLIGLSGSLTADLLLIIALLYCMRLLNQFKQGNIFTQETSELLKRISIMVLIYSILGITIEDTARVMAETFDMPAGKRILSISFGSPNLVFMLYSILVYFVALIMGEAHKIKSDQDLTI